MKSIRKQFKRIVPSVPIRGITNRKEPGDAPGTIVHTGSRRVDEMVIHAIDYDKESLREREVLQLDKLANYLATESITWLQCYGVHDVEKIREVGNQLKIHPLVLEDIAHTNQRPKMEEYDTYFYIVLRLLRRGEQGTPVTSEQLSLILGPNYLFVAQESDDEFFSGIERRLQNQAGRLRTEGSDYLCYAVMDTVVDYYVDVLSQLTERMEALELELLEDPSKQTLGQIHSLRRDLVAFRKAVSPMREITADLIKQEHTIIGEQTKRYFSDVQDHLIQIVDTTDSHKDIVGSMFDTYMSLESNKMNEIMKVLTIIATIFIPLTFIAGIYGMNFNADASPYNMPELDAYYGYPIAMGVMVVVALIMVLFFRRKDWL